MTEANGPNAAPADVKRARLSPVWVIPIVAIALAGYLGFRTLSEKGPQITVYFDTAEGLQVGKTKVKFKAVELGAVTSIDVRSTAPQIVVKARIDNQATEHLIEGSQFWVVRPRIGAAGISGLGTLVSGAYIDFIPGPPGGKKQRQFVGLSDPPEMGAGDPRTRFLLHSPEVGSLQPGSPVYYRQISVGEIGRAKLAKDKRGVVIDVLIDPEHVELVRSNSRFWNVGGIDLSLGLGKAEIRTESLTALLAGGVAFDSRADGTPASPDTAFVLHRSRSELENAAWIYGGLHIVVEASRLGGVKEGDFVLYKEERVGSVVSTALSNDSRVVRIHLNILSRYANLVRTNSVFWNASGISADLGLTGLHVHAESLESLLAGGVSFATPNNSGARVKDGSVFELHPKAKDDWLKWSPGVGSGKGQTHAAKDEAEHHGIIAKFFHHKDKSEEETAAEDHPKDDEKHGFFHRLLH